MKITEISIKLEANRAEEKPQWLILGRNSDRLWSVIDSDLGKRGMFPYEVRLANDIQDLIIQKFNGKINT